MRVRRHFGQAVNAWPSNGIHLAASLLLRCRQWRSLATSPLAAKSRRWYFDFMTQAVAHILEEAQQLSAAERAELADRIVESLAHDIPPGIAAAQIAEVRRRIAEVGSGEVAIIPGDEALARVRQLVASARVVS